MREAPSLDIIKGLIKNGANIKAYCPKGMKEGAWRLKEFKDSITFCEDELDCVKNSNALVVITEWNQFRGLDLQLLKEKMKDNFYFDLRNIHSKNPQIRSLFKYFPVGQR